MKRRVTKKRTFFLIMAITISTICVVLGFQSQSLVTNQEQTPTPPSNSTSSVNDDVFWKQLITEWLS